MFNAHTTIITTEAERLIKRLCTHWGHKFSVEISGRTGRINFGPDFGHCQCLLTGSDQQLSIQLNGSEQADLEKLQPVVLEHLQRMAKEPLSDAVWTEQ